MSWPMHASTRRICLASIVLGLIVGGGCSRGARSLKLEQDVAKQSLGAFLDAWKQGQSVEALQSRTPPIIGRDSDWDAKRKLVSYALVREFNDGTNLHFTVNLVLDAEGRPAVPATYIVGTSPAITVFRDE